MANGTVNKVILLGRLGANPELRQTQSGMSVASATLATNESYKDRASGNKVDNTDWHNLVFWGRNAENLQKYSKKGDSIYVEGKLSTRKWQDKNGNDRYTTEVVVSNMQFMSKSDSKSTNSNQGSYSSSFNDNNSTSNTGSSNNFNFDQEDDIPF